MEIVLKRKIYQQLIDWKNGKLGKCALLIEGARRVGKSTIAEAFAKENYASYVIVDFHSASKAIKDNFIDNVNSRNLDRFFQLLSVYTDTPLYPGKSLIIFDEVQRFPKARECIKDLVQDGRFDYLETGSLISIKENVEGILIPSEEKKIRMFPLDFEEFLWAQGKEALANYIRDCFAKKAMLEDALHKEAKYLFREYMIVGGMPQSIVAYLSSHRSFAEAEKAKGLILDLYQADIGKADRRYRLKVSRLYKNIPGFLSSHDKRIVLKKMGTPSTFDDYSDAFYWLGDSMIANLCFRSNDPGAGLSLSQDDSAVKCYLLDTGLLVSMAFRSSLADPESLYKKLLTGGLSVNEGMFFENAVAQAIASNDCPLFYYSHFSEQSHKNDIEVDFLLSGLASGGGKITPIEVKSSTNYTTISYSRFVSRFPRKVAQGYVIHPKQFKLEGGVTYLPCYMLFCLFQGIA